MRRIHAVLLGLVLPLALAGCGGGGSDGNVRPEAKPSASFITYQRQSTAAALETARAEASALSSEYTALEGQSDDDRLAALEEALAALRARVTALEERLATLDVEERLATLDKVGTDEAGAELVDSLQTVGGYIKTGTEQFDEFSLEHLGRFSGTRNTWNFNGWGLWGTANGSRVFSATISGFNFRNGLNTALLDPYRASVTGLRSFDNPVGRGRAVWRGEVLAYETHPDTFGTPVEGDARVEMDLDSSLDWADVYFTNFTRGHLSMSWYGLSVFYGGFTRGLYEIDGDFYGDRNEGVAGTFERDGLKGIFGAIRE